MASKSSFCCKHVRVVPDGRRNIHILYDSAHLETAINSSSTSLRGPIARILHLQDSYAKKQITLIYRTADVVILPTLNQPRKNYSLPSILQLSGLPGNLNHENSAASDLIHNGFWNRFSERFTEFAETALLRNKIKTKIEEAKRTPTTRPTMIPKLFDRDAILEALTGLASKVVSREVKTLVVCVCGVFEEVVNFSLVVSNRPKVVCDELPNVSLAVGFRGSEAEVDSDVEPSVDVDCGTVKVLDEVAVLDVDMIAVWKGAVEVWLVDSLED